MNISLSESAAEPKRPASIKSLQNGQAGRRKKLQVVISRVRSVRAHAPPAERLRSRGLLGTKHHPPGEETLALISPSISPLQLGDAPSPPRGSQPTSGSDYVRAALPSYQIGRTLFPIMLSVFLPPSLRPSSQPAERALYRKPNLPTF